MTITTDPMPPEGVAPLPARVRKPSPKPKRAGKWGKMYRNPKVEHVEVDGSPAVRVQLSGKRGDRLWMILDPDVWATVSAEIGKVWVVVQPSHCKTLRVVSGRQPAGKHSTDTKRIPILYLARHIVGAERGAWIEHINGEHLDMRRSNLRITPGRVFGRAAAVPAITASVITGAGTLALAPGNKLTLTPLPGVSAAEMLTVMREIAEDRARAQEPRTATGEMV